MAFSLGGSSCLWSRRLLSEAFFAGFAKFYFPTPFGFKNLAGGNPAARVWIQDRIDDISAPGLSDLGQQSST